MPIKSETFTEKLSKKFGSAYRWLRRQADTEALPSIPSTNFQKFYQREEYSNMAMLISFLAVLFLFPSNFSPIIGELIGTAVGGEIISWLSVGFIAFAIYEARRSYDDRMKAKVFEYDLWEGKIREVTESGIVSYPYQLWIEDIFRLEPNMDVLIKAVNQRIRSELSPEDLEDFEPLTSGDLLEDEHGQPLFKDTDRLYLVTSAYRKPDDILKHFIVICDGDISQHETLLSETRAYLGVFGVNRRASDLNFVVAKRMRNQSPILYITDSAVVVNKVMNRDERMKATLHHTLKAEMEEGIMSGERYQNLAENLAAELTESDSRARNWELAYHRAKGEDIREDGIMRPEQPDEAALFSPRQKRLLSYLVVILALVAGGLFVAWQMGYFIPWGLYP